MRDKFRTVSLKNAVWSGGVSVCSVGGEREQIAVNKKPYKSRTVHALCVAQLNTPVPRYCAIILRYFVFRCYDIETRRQHTSHNTTTLNKTSDELLQYGDTPIKASAQC